MFFGDHMRSKTVMHSVDSPTRLCVLALKDALFFSFKLSRKEVKITIMLCNETQNVHVVTSMLQFPSDTDSHSFRIPRPLPLLHSG